VQINIKENSTNIKDENSPKVDISPEISKKLRNI
jgi:hypothetical protein